MVDKWSCNGNLTAVLHRNPFLFNWPLILGNRGELRKRGALSVMIPGTAIPRLSILS